MTIEELIGDFARENEDKIKEFAPKYVKHSNNEMRGPNLGISSSIDKTFSRVELEKSMSRT
jgi:hypothetical protein